MPYLTEASCLEAIANEGVKALSEINARRNDRSESAPSIQYTRESYLKIVNAALSKYEGSKDELVDFASDNVDDSYLPEGISKDSVLSKFLNNQEVDELSGPSERYKMATNLYKITADNLQEHLSSARSVLTWIYWLSNDSCESLIQILSNHFLLSNEGNLLLTLLRFNKVLYPEKTSPGFDYTMSSEKLDTGLNQFLGLLGWLNLLGEDNRRYLQMQIRENRSVEYSSNASLLDSLIEMTDRSFRSSAIPAEKSSPSIASRSTKAAQEKTSDTEHVHQKNSAMRTGEREPNEPSPSRAPQSQSASSQAEIISRKKPVHATSKEQCQNNSFKCLSNIANASLSFFNSHRRKATFAVIGTAAAAASLVLANRVTVRGNTP